MITLLTSPELAELSEAKILARRLAGTATWRDQELQRALLALRRQIQERVAA